MSAFRPWVAIGVTLAGGWTQTAFAHDGGSDVTGSVPLTSDDQFRGISQTNNDRAPSCAR